MSTSNYFEQYEQDFKVKSGKLKERIKQLNNFSGERRKQLVTETERQIDDLKQIVRRMDDAASKSKDQKKLQPRAKEAWSEVARLEKEYQRISLMDATFPYREGYEQNEDDDIETQSRSRALWGTQKVEETSTRLINAQRVASETENIGIEVVYEMGKQKEQLYRAKDNLSQIDDNMDKGRKILSHMTRRIITNDFILAFIILVLIVAIGMIIYFKWISKLVK
mmetsp:Transcript_21755/g.30439  ORF Transcript_21755/g.30439 Transcript_21755/m.30439 type:complete len:223 (+) Transcript_21755:66-734(+)